MVVSKRSPSWRCGAVTAGAGFSSAAGKAPGAAGVGLCYALPVFPQPESSRTAAMDAVRIFLFMLTSKIEMKTFSVRNKRGLLIGFALLLQKLQPIACLGQGPLCRIRAEMSIFGAAIEDGNVPPRKIFAGIRAAKMHTKRFSSAACYGIVTEKKHRRRDRSRNRRSEAQRRSRENNEKG